MPGGAPSGPRSYHHAEMARKHPSPTYGSSCTPSWREVRWSEHERQAALSGGTLSYVDYGAGEGPPVVMIHGLGGNWAAWLENIPAVATRRRVIAVDLPGFGRSELTS